MEPPAKKKKAEAETTPRNKVEIKKEKEDSTPQRCVDIPSHRTVRRLAGIQFKSVRKASIRANYPMIRELSLIHI